MLGFLIAVAAGYLTPHLEGPVARPIAKMLSEHIKLEPEETRLIAFMVALLAAVIIGALLSTGSTFGIIIGAILGYFGQRIFDVLKKTIDGRSDAE